jgi:hypothetical protein
MQAPTFGGRGTIHPSSKALSMMVASMVLMVTGSWLMPSTHAPCRKVQRTNKHLMHYLGTHMHWGPVTHLFVVGTHSSTPMDWLSSCRL